MNGADENAGSTGRPRYWLATPVLAVTYLVLTLFAQNWYEATLREVAPCWVALGILSIAVALIFRLAMGAARAGLAAVVFLAWLFTFSTYMSYCKAVLDKGGHATAKLGVLLGMWLLALVLCLLLVRSRRWTDQALLKANQFVTLCGVILVVLAGGRCVSLAMGMGADEAATRRGSPGDEGESWASNPIVDADWTPAQPPIRRDVYYLVFDRYGCEGTLRKRYDLDNSKFYESLEQRDFRVYRDCHSGYPMTVLAMASTLNMRFHKPIFTGASDYAGALDDHEVGRLFKKAGYRYHHIGNTYGPLRKCSIADTNFPVSLLPSEFADALLEMTPIDGLFGTWFKHRQIRQQFAAIAAVANEKGPTFTYAHFLLPHDPYVFKKDGSRLPWYSRPRAEEREAYIEQLTAANKMILETIDSVIKNSSEKPIIILQADEGPYLFTRDQALPRVEKIAKRTGILSAIYIPDEPIAARLPEQWASVNTFRFLLREYFGATLEPLANRVFYWETANLHGTPIEGSRIVDVTEELGDVK